MTEAGRRVKKIRNRKTGQVRKRKQQREETKQKERIEETERNIDTSRNMELNRWVCSWWSFNFSIQEVGLRVSSWLVTTNSLHTESPFASAIRIAGSGSQSNGPCRRREWDHCFRHKRLCTLELESINSREDRRKGRRQEMGAESEPNNEHDWIREEKEETRKREARRETRWDWVQHEKLTRRVNSSKEREMKTNQ